MISKKFNPIDWLRCAVARDKRGIKKLTDFEIEERRTVKQTLLTSIGMANARGNHQSAANICALLVHMETEELGINRGIFPLPSTGDLNGKSFKGKLKHQERYD